MQYGRTNYHATFRKIYRGLEKKLKLGRIVQCYFLNIILRKFQAHIAIIEILTGEKFRNSYHIDSD